jgi:hypothetical protein
MSKYGNRPSWREIDGTLYYFKSKMEYRYALYLEWLRLNKNITDWMYESRTFDFPIKHGITRYTPDFCVIENHPLNWHWIEVKGYFTRESKTKIKRFQKYFPQEKLEIVDGKWFTRNSRKLSSLIPGWKC